MFKYVLQPDLWKSVLSYCLLLSLFNTLAVYCDLIVMLICTINLIPTATFGDPDTDTPLIIMSLEELADNWLNVASIVTK